jgi:hypothetical protein
MTAGVPQTNIWNTSPIAKVGTISRRDRQAYKISFFPNDMNLHDVLLIHPLEWLEETEISHLQIVVTCKLFPPFGEPFTFKRGNDAPHFPFLAMSLE